MKASINHLHYNMDLGNELLQIALYKFLIKYVRKVCFQV